MTLVLSGVSAQPLAAMQQSGFLNKLGAENIAADVFGALNRARRARPDADRHSHFGGAESVTP
ncbi:MAG: hypothetical protein H0W76_16990 [Pyrinomonadaceae bacterium]|nr:hypothetical protein [Pyrinomonadaceae bacterium]